MDAGDPETAVLFHRHAVKLDPENGSYLAALLHALNLADRPAAEELADRVLQERAEHSPASLLRAAAIKFMSARTSSEMEARRVFELLEIILKDILAGFERHGVSGADRPLYVEAIALLAFGYEFLGKSQAALELYSLALRLEPDNDAFLVARGVLLYGASPRAAADLERAIQCKSPAIWPYVLLAHYHLIGRRFEECRRLCERAMDMEGSGAVISEVCEWRAIAEAALAYPDETVRASFENAIRLDPSNERAKRNLAAFEIAQRPVPFDKWETRSAGAVRTSGLAERRFAMVA